VRAARIRELLLESNMRPGVRFVLLSFTLFLGPYQALALLKSARLGASLAKYDQIEAGMVGYFTGATLGFCEAFVLLGLITYATSKVKRRDR